MTLARKAKLNKRLEQQLQTLKSLSLQFVSFLIEEGFRGQTLDKIVTSFTRHQAKVISSLLGSAGLAGGAWAAVSLWTGSLGLWSGLAYGLGFLTMPVWVPVAGGVAGLTAAGGAVYGVLNLVKSRNKGRKVQSIIGFSKVLIGKDVFEDQDDRLMRRFLKDQKVRGWSHIDDRAATLCTHLLPSATRGGHQHEHFAGLPPAPGPTMDLPAKHCPPAQFFCRRPGL